MTSARRFQNLFALPESAVALAFFLLPTPYPHSLWIREFFRDSLEDQIPENHLLRLIDRYVSFDFVREKLKESYSDTGRPSIDPEVLLRILLIGYLYGITSERRLIEELRMHLAWRWFTGLGFDQEIPHHSTFSKNRHGRFEESNLFQQLFEEIVGRCMKAGLVEGEHLSVDGSFIQANASNGSRVPRAASPAALDRASSGNQVTPISSAAVRSCPVPSSADVRCNRRKTAAPGPPSANKKGISFSRPGTVCNLGKPCSRHPRSSFSRALTVL